MDRTGWRLGAPHPHRPAHGGPMQNGGQRSSQCIDQGMPAQCTGRQVSPRVESCVRWQDSTLFKEILEQAAATGGTRSGQPTARSLF